MSSEKGGKARGLELLDALKLNVPKFMVISADKAKCFEDASIPQIIEQIGTGPYAIRSSASIEDSNIGSFAGLFETELGVSIDELRDSIKRVAGSGASKRIAEYANSKNISVPDGSFVNVIIQKLINPDLSGVALSYAPNTGKELALIESIIGLGELLVSGKVEPNQILVNRCNNSIAKELEGNQRYKLTSTGLKKMEIVKHSEIKLSKSAINHILNTLFLLEKKLGGPVDLEFCVANDEVYYLQARPLLSF